MAKMDLAGTTARVNAAIEKIKSQYLAEDGNLPWLIGYSGGKDSTCTAQLVFRALVELKEAKKPLRRRVIVFSSDTMIENPLVKAIIQKNIELINKSAKENSLPLEAIVLKPELSKTFWVNIIGRGYPCPNTMFRWCTDRLKIEPANSFVRRFIDKNGETIMVLGVRQGESQTRDRVLKQHGVEGERLMRHTTLPNAYVFPPIIELTTIDVFTYLSEFKSPWGSSNRELFFFYDEAGGGECPIFLSEQDKTSKNSCGNSRLGCWVCTVVSQDKSLSGFIATGFHDSLKPLLEFRNWIATIRDKDEYRCRFRANGSMYYVQLQTKKDPQDGSTILIIPKKGDRNQLDIKLNQNGEIADKTSQFFIVEEGKLSEYMSEKSLSTKSTELAYAIIRNPITGEYSRLGTGPFTQEARVEILKRLLDSETKYRELSKTDVHLILDSELVEIMKLWKKAGEDTEIINELLAKHGRKPLEVLEDDFDIFSNKYSSEIKALVRRNHLDMDIVNRLLQIEKEHSFEDQRTDAQQEILSAFSSDRFNF